MIRKIKNWHEFQHYKGRDPPWIKLHKRIMTDRQWHMLSGDDAKALIMLWLIASEHAGNLLADDDIAFKLHMKVEEILPLLERLNHWLEDGASAPLAARKQLALSTEQKEQSREELENSKGEFSNSSETEERTPPSGDAPLAHGSRRPNGGSAAPYNGSQGMSPDQGLDYRSPSRTKSDNVLQPVPEQPPLNPPKKAAPEQASPEITPELREIIQGTGRRKRTY
jgi:hypothetical protein